MVLGPTQHVVFPQVRLRFWKKGKCKCGKMRRRTTTIIHTVNPFNKNADGVPKNVCEVRADVISKGRKWESDPITCANCE